MMKTYTNYKASGVEWLGDIPEDWGLQKLKYFSDVTLGKMLQTEKKALHDYKPYLKAKNIMWFNVSLEQIESMWISKNEVNKLLLIKNDLLVSEGGEVGRTAIWNNELEECYIQNSVNRVRVNTTYCNAKYILYFFSFYGAVGYFWTITNAVSLAHLTKDKLKEVKFLLPPLSEQQTIANYLDKKTAQIARFIENKKKLIQLLEEEKKALITQAVTRGLDKSVRLKPSGVEWLGDIPEHWEVRRTKFLSIINPSRSATLSKYSKEIVSFLPMEKVSTNGNVDYSIQRQVNEVSEGFTCFEKGDVVIAKITPCFENGKGALLKDMPTVYGFGTTEFHVVRCKKELSSRFYYLISTTVSFRKIGEIYMTGSAGQQRIPTSYVVNYLIPLPSLPEQQAIVAHIEKQSQKIDEVISKYQKEIELIIEYRQRLIYDAVTGKIKLC